MPQRILLIDDDNSRIEALEAALKNVGYTDVRSTSDARRALPLFREFQPDLLLIDLNTQRLDGLTIIQQIVSRVPEREFLPILITTPDLSPSTRAKALEAGARGFLPRGFDPAELRIRVRNLLHDREMHMLLEERVRARTQQLEQAEVEVAKRLAFAAEVRDYPDGSHPT